MYEIAQLCDRVNALHNQIEVEEGERVRVVLIKTGSGITHVGGEEIIAYFMPGVLTLMWNQGGVLNGQT